MASILDALPSGPEDRNDLSDLRSPALDVVGEAQSDPPDESHWAEYGPVPTTEDRRGRGLSRLSLQYHLAVSDAVALTLVWVPLALTGAGADRGRQLVGAALAIALTMISMQRAGLYRSHVCAMRSREVGRVLVSTVIGALAFAGCEWLAGTAKANAPSSARASARR